MSDLFIRFSQKIDEWEMSQELKGEKLTVRWKRSGVSGYQCAVLFLRMEEDGGIQPLWRKNNSQTKINLSIYIVLAKQCFNELLDELK